MSLKTKLQHLWQRICWNAWSYARRREIAQAERRGVDSQASDDQSPEQRRTVANEARQVLENRHFREAFAAVADHIEGQAMACDPSQTERAGRIVLAKQLLEKIRRELVHKMEDGYMAEVQIAEIEKKRGLARFLR